MNKKNFHKIISVFLLFFTVVAPFYSQAHEDDDEALERLLNSDSQSNVTGIIPELQKDFVIIEGIREHDLNPQTTSYADDAQIMTGLYEGLFSYNPRTLEPVFAIAIDFKISRDKKRWQFTINPNARFSNGDKITAEDVRQSWLQLLSTPSAPYASLLDVIINAEEFRKGKCVAGDVGIYALKENELSIYLKEPANYLPKVLCHSAFSVIHQNPTVFSGPFYLDDYSSGVYILKKNPFYWDAENTHLEQITILQSDEEDENAFYYNTGIVDWVSTSLNTNKLLSRDAVQVGAEFATNYLFFKLQTAKPEGAEAFVWDLPEFRNVIFEIMPWKELRDGYYYPATTFVYPLSGYSSVEGFTYTDPIEAKKLMKAAREKYEIPAEYQIPLVLEINENALSDEKINIMKTAFGEVGVELVVIKKTFAAYLQGIPDSMSDMFCYSWIGDFADPLAFLELFRSDSTLNESGWHNTEFDSLLKQAAEITSEERYRLLAKAEEILLDSYMIIPIQHSVSFNIINTDEVGGWVINAFDIHPLKYLYRKERKNTLPNVVLK